MSVGFIDRRRGGLLGRQLIANRTLWTGYAICY